MEGWKKLRETDWWENANEKEKGKYKTQIQDTYGKNTNYKIQNTQSEDVEEKRRQRWRRWGGKVEILWFSLGTLSKTF